MKQRTFFATLAVFLLACSILTQVDPAALPATDAPILPTDTPTSTPITPTFTFTPTPPLLGFKTWTPTPTITPIFPTFTPMDLPTLALNTPTPPVQMNGFISINLSQSEFYKRPACQPSSVKFTAQALEAKTAFVTLSVRFKSRQTGTTSKWTTLTMDKLGGGTFAYELISDVMIGVDIFENAWVQYQLVALDSGSDEIGRTGIFSERLTLLECEATPTPEPTQTPLVP
ncbi:MAG: hypothetical protein HYZ23_05065 [Chloroflexi bacterium]|nr:hypothetical protein [Chloroflexota bacterium]